MSELHCIGDLTSDKAMEYLTVKGKIDPERAVKILELATLECWAWRLFVVGWRVE